MKLGDKETSEKKKFAWISSLQKVIWTLTFRGRNSVHFYDYFAECEIGV